MSMAMEGRFGKSVRADWPRILRRILPQGFWQRFLRQVPAATDPRTCWQPKYVVLCWVFIGWLCAPGLGERFEQAWELLAALFPQRRRPGRTYQSLMKRSRRMEPGVLRTFLHGLHAGLAQQLAGLWTWHGWTVFAVDGTRVEAPRTRRNERHLGCAGRDKTGPQWAVTALLHLPSRLLWDWRQGPGTQSERGHLREMIERLPCGALLLADAGFTGYALLRRLMERRIDFLIRCGSNVRLLIRRADWQVAFSSTRARTVYLWPQERRDEPPLVLRLIVVQRRGRPVYLLTNVTNPSRLPPAAASRLYAARWGIEVNYRSLKQTLGRRKLLAASPEMGAWELAGNVLALALLLAHAAWLLGGQAAQASVARLWRALRTALERLRYAASTRRAVAAFGTALRDDYRRRRSKRARDWPHKKRQRPPGAPKLRRLTKREEALIDRTSSQWITPLG
jgi:hypothetical protein